MIKTVDNYFSDLASSKNYFIDYGNDFRRIGNGIEINLSEYIKYKNNKVFSFFKINNFKEKLSENEIIISIKSNQAKNSAFVTKTGNYVGKFFWDGIEINIGSRFSNEFLKRMLNFANNVYLDDVDVSGKTDLKNNIDISKFVLYYLFVQSLENAFLVGLPKSYSNVQSHELKLKGRVIFNKFIKNDIPFVGRVSSLTREQKENQDIINVLYKAISIIESSEFDIKHIAAIKLHLREGKSKTYICDETIKRAMNNKSLQNPLFASYKKVLEYAQIIIKNKGIEESAKKDKKFYGFIINIAELYELYISKLLKKEFTNWIIESPLLSVYDNQFFKRYIIPDIVMTSGNKVMVFDTKYKRMNMTGKSSFGMGDIDRTDFFQINTYMSYYQNQGNDVLLGGLLYPMEKFESQNCHSNSWFSNKKTKFIVDGIDLTKHEGVDFSKIEREFVNRLQILIS